MKYFIIFLLFAAYFCECPLNLPYLDSDSDSVHPVCLPSCLSTAPYVFIESGVLKCVS